MICLVSLVPAGRLAMVWASATLACAPSGSTGIVRKTSAMFAVGRAAASAQSQVQTAVQALS